MCKKSIGIMWIIGPVWVSCQIWPGWIVEKRVWLVGERVWEQ